MSSLVLASTSSYRMALLEKLGIPFIAVAPNIDEQAKENETAEHLVVRLAIEKATTVAISHPDGLIIGSDQVCVLNNQITGKPHNKTNAMIQLSQASGQCITFYTGLCLYNGKSGQYEALCETFEVHFRQLTESEISAYLDKERPWNCAGSFKCEGLGIALFDRLAGSDPNTLVGLPLISLTKLLIKAGINPLTYQSGR
ncbi:Maf family protein [Budvicia diplopodorum]|uniref:Maf family protein n=1 Tax=Budvicia diplopodorum TaxID=1119056 RepID=UPI0013585A5D|nr:nucleoside triphosphate pyrophosphatase [Budvicia diplopodorum]